jgi:hypothetical protein
MHIYSLPCQSDITGIHKPFFSDDEQDWMEKSLYSRRHDGLYKSRLEQFQEDLLAEQENDATI